MKSASTLAHEQRIELLAEHARSLGIEFDYHQNWYELRLGPYGIEFGWLRGDFSRALKVEHPVLGTLRIFEEDLLRRVAAPPGWQGFFRSHELDRPYGIFEAAMELLPFLRDATEVYRSLPVGEWFLLDAERQLDRAISHAADANESLETVRRRWGEVREVVRREVSLDTSG